MMMSVSPSVIGGIRGKSVYTSDGARLGNVDMVHGGYFKVRVPLEADCWLPAGCIRSVEGGLVMVDLAKDQLADYRADDPTRVPSPKAA